MHGVVPLAVVNGALFVTLQARPGPIAIELWTWGPPILVAAAAVLLGAALVSARRSRQIWTWQRTAALAGLTALVGSIGLYRTFPSEHDGSPSAVSMRLPLDGPLTVAWGGPSRRVNQHVRSPSERWGFDLLVTIDGRTHAGAGNAVTDYHAYNQPVRAPADGRVIGVHDNEPDATPRHPEPSRRGGNWIVIEVAQGEYLFLLHFKAGSLRVAPGDRVSRGDVLGHVGNSGNSTEPHLHVHLQDTPSFNAGQAIPFYFADYINVRTGVRVAHGMPEGGVRRGRYVGDVVRRAGSGSPEF